MIVQAYAKINWALNLTGVRPNGYHELDMLMQSISLHDTLEIEPADELTLACDAPGVPTDERNLVLKAALALQKETGCERGAAIRLIKRVPSQAGLGGGSGDCAAALLALNRMWGLCLSRTRLEALALSLGADVPFCLTGGLARAKGLGEALTPLDGLVPRKLLVVKPEQGLGTPQVYRRADELKDERRADIDQTVKALAERDDRLLGKAAFNMLYPAAESLCPAVRETVNALYRLGASFAAMSGSGTACFALFEREADRLRAAEAMENVRTYLCETAAQGVKIE